MLGEPPLPGSIAELDQLTRDGVEPLPWGVFWDLDGHIPVRLSNSPALSGEGWETSSSPFQSRLWQCCVPESDHPDLGGCRPWPQALGKERKEQPRVDRAGRVVPQCFCSSCRTCPGLAFPWNDPAGNGPHLETTKQAAIPPKGPFLLFHRGFGMLLQTFHCNQTWVGLPCPLHSMLPTSCGHIWALRQQSWHCTHQAGHTHEHRTPFLPSERAVQWADPGCLYGAGSCKWCHSTPSACSDEVLCFKWWDL